MSIAHLVISACKYNCSYVPTLIKCLNSADIEVTRVSLYYKCGMTTLCSRYATNVSTLANLGRNDHTYASHILNHYDSLPPLVFFLKDTHAKFRWGNVPKARRRRRRQRPMIHEYACLSSVSYSVSDVNKSRVFTRRMGQEYRSANAGHESATPNVSFHSVRFATAANFLHSLHIHADAERRVPVCLGGYFYASASAIRNQPRSFYATVVHLLSRGDNVIESHFMERAWLQAFTRPLAPRPDKDSRPAAEASEANGGLGRLLHLGDDILHRRRVPGAARN